MWALVDAVAGPQHAVRRHLGHVVPDSHASFDAGAIQVNDTIYDSQRAYHAGQSVLLNVDTGRWVLLDPSQVCGVGRKYWMTDHRLTGALRRGHPPPWHIMRGAQFRLRLRVAPSLNATMATGRRPTVSQVQRAVEGLALSILRSWGCQKPNIRECTYEGAIQRNCAKRLRVEVVERGGTHDVPGSDRTAWMMLRVKMGEVGGSCHRATVTLQRILRAAIPPVAASLPGAPEGRQLLPWPPSRSVRRVSAKSGASRDGDGMIGANAGVVPGRSEESAAAAAQDAIRLLGSGLRGTLATIRRRGDVELAPHCVSYCRPTSYLECPPGSVPYEALMRQAAFSHAEELGATSTLRLNQSLAVLTFLYAANLDGEMTETFAKWNLRSYGHGADMIVLGATWQSVMRTAPADTRGGRALAWDPNTKLAWARALSACSKVARCLLRTVPENLRQDSPMAYRDFARLVAPVAKAASAGIIDNFPGTWAGARELNLLRHHDSTRIHFSDTGRAFLAQLTLNAVPFLLPSPATRLPAPEVSGRIELSRIMSTA